LDLGRRCIRNISQHNARQHLSEAARIDQILVTGKRSGSALGCSTNSFLPRTIVSHRRLPPAWDASAARVESMPPGSIAPPDGESNAPLNPRHPHQCWIRRLGARAILPLQGESADEDLTDVTSLSRHPRQRAAVAIPAVASHIDAHRPQEGRKPFLGPQSLDELVLAMRAARLRRVDVQDANALFTNGKCVTRR
jgi:hypothetical protein